jgi:glyoxylase I family protein
MKINKVHHIAVICSDYERSKAFYVETLGFRVIREVHRAERQSYKLDLDIDGRTQIELFSFPDPPARPSYPEARGLRHVALEVDDVEAAIAELNAKGIAVEPVRVDPHTGKKATFFADPDGLPWELYEA